METVEAQILVCGCCGAYLRDTPEENTHHGIEPYPDDNGFGMCRGCGGTGEFGDCEDAEQVKKAQGSAQAMFYEARIESLPKRLNEANAARFLGLPYWKQCIVINRLIESGSMI